MTNPPNRKLSTDEVNALLDDGSENPARARGPEPLPERRAETYDFFEPRRFKQAELEKLRQINTALALQCARNAARLLRDNVSFQLIGMDQMKWQNILREFEGSPLGVAFKLIPLDQRGIVLVDRSLGARCLEKMMGGAASGKELPEEITGLEKRVLGHFVSELLAPLPEHWRNIGQFTTQLESFVDDFQSSGLFPADENMFQLSFLMQGNIGSGQIAILVPFEAVKFLPPQTEEKEATSFVSADLIGTALRKNVVRAPVELAAVIGTAEIKVRELLQLARRDVLVLDAAIDEPLDVRVNDKVKCKGFVGVSKGKIAVKLNGG